MNKTQIQVPEDLFREIRAFAQKREWSLAETFRRGAELLLQVYPDTTASAGKDWKPPTSSRAGWKGLSAEQLRDAAFADTDRICAFLAPRQRQTFLRALISS